MQCLTGTHFEGKEYYISARQGAIWHFNALVMPQDGKAIPGWKEFGKSACLGDCWEEGELRCKWLLDQFVKIPSFCTHRLVLLGPQLCTSYADDDLYRNQQCELWKNNGSVLPEAGTSWPRGEDCMVMSIAESVETQSDSDVDGVKVQGWGSDSKFRNMGMKRKQTAFLLEVQAPANHARERQRGKNWEKTEEDILVESKGKDMDWKSISECLKSKGFIRDHRHCSDKWYALRKHYIEIQQWIIQNPNTSYWDLTDSERIRTVPSSFCQRWYQIFDAACQKPEVRKRVQQSLNPRRRPDSGQHFAPTDPSPSPSGPSFPLYSSPRFDPTFVTRPSCQPSVPLEGSQRYAGDRFYSGDAAYESERREAGDYLPNQAEEEERIRNMEIKEKKLQLKIDRFQYKRQRDEEMRKRPLGLMP